MSSSLYSPRGLALALGLIALGPWARPAWGQNSYLVRNLVSDLVGIADVTDTNLVNPWGIATSPTGPFWISDNHTGLSTLYNTTGTPMSLIVNIPPPAGGMPPAGPTGIIFNSTTNFIVVSNTAAKFIFATEDGTISAWSSGSNAVLKADRSATGAVYKGLTFGNSGGSNFLYAANFNAGTIDVFDASFALVTLPGSFADATIPAGFAPFTVQNLGGSNLYVTYAMQDAAKHDDVEGAGNGFVNVFDTSGHLVKRLVSHGPLDSPWGLTMAPAGFGQFGGALLVGNFGDGIVNAFDASTGALLGSLADPAGKPIAVMGMWGLKFGNGGSGGDTNTLYFTAGIPAGGNLEDHGLFGSVSVLNGIEFTGFKVNGNSLTLGWVGGTPPYLIQKKNGIADTNWIDVLTTTNQIASVAFEGGNSFYRASDHAATAVTPFTVSMSAAAEVPVVTNSTAFGFGSLTLEGNTLTYHITYSGLSGKPTAAHIHGPATTAQSVGVIVPLGPLGADTSGTLTGTIDLSTFTAAQVSALKSGQTYANIHTSLNPAGEIRGQIAPVLFSTTLNGAGEVPPVTTGGTGSATFALIGNQLNFTLSYAGLSAPATASHIHGPASATANASVLIGLPGVSGTSGNVSGAVTLTPAQLGTLIDEENAGLTYVNIHTSTHPGGEIRGQISP
ncbi:MAG: TIGR03118 family protein [Limisphaerales bacterium]